MITAISMYLRLFILCNANEKIAINGGILATLVILGQHDTLNFFSLLFSELCYKAPTKMEERRK